MKRWCVAAALVAALLPAGSRADDLGALLAGPPGPVALRQLGTGWFSFRAALPGVGKPSMATLPGLMGAPTPAVYFTQGRQVQVGPRKLLVAYSVDPTDLDMIALVKLGEQQGQSPGKAILDILAPVAGPDAPLSLHLLDLATTNLDGLRPLDRQAEETRRRPLQPGVATMAAILVPVFAQARQRARETVDLSNLRQIGLAMQMYGMDHGKVPPMGSLGFVKTALRPYLRNDALFTSPRGGPYRFNALLSEAEFSSVRSTDVVAYHPTPTTNGQVVVLFGDGRARMVGAVEWQQIRSRAKLR